MVMMEAIGLRLSGHVQYPLCASITKSYEPRKLHPSGQWQRGIRCPMEHKRNGLRVWREDWPSLTFIVNILAFWIPGNAYLYAVWYLFDRKRPWQRGRRGGSGHQYSIVKLVMKISSEFHSECRKPYLRFTEIKFGTDSFFIRDDSKELCVFLF